ncbi:hypothetical protein [Sphingomonas psychrotolerans]|uniref:VanZ-like domain-containing protein n=1 Tax=Sphingomonas psychrotolerans TaxID=1327635 RepID=A0A2K8MKM3_9SPHN|nr:hypothetical protein [Sphingomonas psychrotolerans]ATY31741.1 hypothetical protein CVN68_06975 [Sphingomonas psychrotolerans]
MSPLQAIKFWLIQHLGLAKDALHVHVGLLLFVGSALLFRWPLRSWKPWAVALAATLLGEAWDLRDSLVYHTRIDLWGNLHDVWNTMLWPSLFVVLARTTRLFGGQAARR